MKSRHHAGRRNAVIAVCLLLAGVNPPASAQAASPAKPLELRKIMQAMGKDMQAITDGISREDWALVAKLAPLIAQHPQPPMGEKVRILSYLGADAATFKRHDEDTNRAAQAMVQAALRNDGAAVIGTFATLQNSCLACHRNFREPFVRHFYGELK